MLNCMSTRTFAEAKAKNALLMCEACGEKPRQGLGRLCSRCSFQRCTWGEVGATAVRLNAFRDSLRKVRPLLEVNRKHDAILYGEGWFRNQLRLAVEGSPAAIAPKQLGKLAEFKVDPFDMLVLTAAVYVQWKFGDRRLLSVRHALFVASNLVLRLVPVRGRDLPNVHRKNFALAIGENLLPLLDNVFQTLKRRNEEIEAAKGRMTARLEIPPITTAEVANAT